MIVIEGRMSSFRRQGYNFAKNSTLLESKLLSEFPTEVDVI